MSDSTLHMNHVIQPFNEALYHMINVKIKKVVDRLPVRADPGFIRAVDGTAEVYAFVTQISGNRKEIDGSFTIDAFTGLVTPFTIEFGIGEEILGSFENITTSSIEPLDALFTGITVPDATNAWLQDILNNQE